MKRSDGEIEGLSVQAEAASAQLARLRKERVVAPVRGVLSPDGDEPIERDAKAGRFDAFVTWLLWRGVQPR